MLLPGYWLLCEDGVCAPYSRSRLVTGGGLPLTVEFLADTGADRTVLCAAVLRDLGLPTLPAPTTLAGVGGSTADLNFPARSRHLCAPLIGTSLILPFMAQAPQPPQAMYELLLEDSGASLLKYS